VVGATVTSSAVLTAGVVTAAGATSIVSVAPSGRKLDFRVGPADFGERFGQDDRVVLHEPVLEERIRNANGNRLARIGGEARRLEPGMEAVVG